MTCMGCMRHAWDGKNDNDRPLYIWEKHTEGDHYVIGDYLKRNSSSQSLTAGDRNLKISSHADGLKISSHADCLKISSHREAEG